MVLDSKRSEVDFIMEPMARALSFMSPDAISVVALILAFFSGLLLYMGYETLWLLPIAATVVLVSGLFDALDGKVARMKGIQGPRGDFLDHVFDRYADVFMIGGVAVSSWCDPYIGMLALVGVLLTSYMGTQAQAVGAGRLYAGLLGRADRVVLLTAGAIVQWLASSLWVGSFDLWGYELTVLGAVMWWFAIIGNLTAVQRAAGTWRSF